MRYKVVQVFDGEFIVTEPTDILAWADVNGVAVSGFNKKPWQRAELQGQPMLSSFCGPMWDGNDTIRYEDQRANDILST